VDQTFSLQGNQIANSKFCRCHSHFFRPPAPGSAEMSFSCTRKQGAVLSLPVTAQREDTLAQAHFRQWITRHIDSWFAFSQRHGLGIEMGDILFVTGCHRTRSSGNIVFYESQVNARVSFAVQVPGIVGTTVNWQVSSQHIQGAVVSHGPSGEVCGTQIAIANGY